MKAQVADWLIGPLWRCAPGEALHRAALSTAHRGDAAAALLLIARAARRYRDALEVEALARLRIHEHVIRLKAGRGFPREASGSTLEERLLRLEQIESLAPPFDPMPAAEFAARWLGAGAAAGEDVARVA
jgi:hypothetical protein